jgi:hypothetical protein
MPTNEEDPVKSADPKGKKTKKKNLPETYW